MEILMKNNECLTEVEIIIEGSTRCLTETQARETKRAA